MKKKLLPIGVQTFSQIVEENYLYIDKTRNIYSFLEEGGKYYFLSRPRRFGKSLLISTLMELFSGNRELFEGLWIYNKIEWQEFSFPIIHIDCSGVNFRTADRLEESLGRLMEDIAASFDILLDPERYCNEKFKQLIEKLANKMNKRVVVLIDEYDKPIIDKIQDREIAKENREVLREFYGIIKNSDKHIKFAFLTGVSKFSKTSVFSGLNNLRDITLSDSYSTLLGYTQDELEYYFAPYIETYCREKKVTKENLLGEVKKWYNGYSWDGAHFLYNPHSILSFFQEERFSNYWFSTGTPSFLVNALKEKQKDTREYENLPVGDYAFESFDIEHLDTTAMLIQTGNLTIKERTADSRFILNFPNKEVQESMIRHLFTAYTDKEMVEGIDVVRRLTSSLEEGDCTTFFDILKTLFASIPYNTFLKDREAYYHTIIYMIIKLMGVDIATEVQTNKGRIDAILKTAKIIYIMEFKVGSAKDALAQIKKKKYYQPYLIEQKVIKLIGVGFDAKDRNIKNFVMEEVSPL